MKQQKSSLSPNPGFNKTISTVSRQKLAKMPELGAQRSFRNPRWSAVRAWPVNGFERYLIFYRPFTDGVEILRVIHGARDIERLFR